MNHISPHALLDGVKNGVIIDGRGMTDILEQLDSFFRNYRVDRLRCLCLCPENTIESALVLLYFLANRVNFFLRPSSAGSGIPAPAFCDKLLRVTSEGTMPRSLSGRMQLEDNPAYIPAEIDANAVPGAVIFSSSGTTGQAKFIFFRSDKLLL